MDGDAAGLRRVAFLTLADPTDFVIDDPLAVAPLRALGWEVVPVVWDEPGVDWRAFDRVVIRTPWDYQDRPAQFLRVLEEIAASGTPLDNDLSLVRWNLRKSYLRELAAAGVAVVPTLWRERLGPGDLARLLADLPADEAVVKPVVSANADGAYWLDRRRLGKQAAEVEAYYADRPLLAQPFARAVRTEGEHSLFYFDGAYSHAVTKTPRPGDFRVQEEHGGIIQALDPDPVLRAAGDRLLAALPGTPLQARADFVRANDGNSFWLMELELIEPSLYLRMHPEAPARFARALDARARRC